jgi:hypothetical protein
MIDRIAVSHSRRPANDTMCVSVVKENSIPNLMMGKKKKKKKEK